MGTHHHHQLKMSAIARLSVSPRLAMAWMRPPPPRPPPSCTPPPPSRTLTAPPSSSELEPPLWVSLDPELVLDLCSDPSSRLRQEPLPQAAAFLLRYPWIHSVRGYGSVLFDDGLPSALRFLRSEPIHLIYTGGVVLI